jgi:hypothetical protein
MTTKLEAVNDVMRRLGKLAVGALDTDGNSTEAHVERFIDDASKRVMKSGWAWNTKFDVEVTPDESTNKVQVNQLEPVGDGNYYEIYHVDTYAESEHIHVMRSSNFLYDLGKNQNTFADYTTLKLIYVYERAFTEIPPQFTDWIVSIAAFKYNQQFMRDQSGAKPYKHRTDQSVLQSLMLEMQQAEVEAKREELRMMDINVLNTAEMKQIRGRPRMQNRSIH